MVREPRQRQREQRQQEQHELCVANTRRKMIALLTLSNYLEL